MKSKIEQGARPSLSTSSDLCSGVTALAYELLEFVKSFGPSPVINVREDLPEAVAANWARIPRVNDGYMNRFHPRVEKAIYGLGEIDIRDWELNELANRKAFSENDIRTIAEKLLVLRNKLELREHGVPLTWAEVDRMPADDYNRRYKADPNFRKQVDALPRRN